MTRRVALGSGLAGIAAVTLSPLDDARNAVTAQDATPITTTADATFSSEEQLALTTIVESSLAQTNSPGALIGIWYPGRGDWTYAAGIKDLATAAPVTLDDYVRIASITKTFTATVILQLVDEGKLSLDDVLETFVPGIASGDQITVRQVLGMTAGIFDFVEDPIVSADYELDPLMGFTPRDAVEVIRQYPADPPRHCRAGRWCCRRHPGNVIPATSASVHRPSDGSPPVLGWGGSTTMECPSPMMPM